MKRRRDRDGASGSGAGEETHPSDALPAYVRGSATDGPAVERHLEGCRRCREEVRLLRALAERPPPLGREERERMWEGVSAAVAGRRPSRPRWMSAAWKVAAAVALVAGGFGTWQVNRQAPRGMTWDPAAALRGWEEDLAGLRPAAEDVRLALGYETEGAGLPWEDLAEEERLEVPVPWEESP